MFSVPEAIDDFDHGAWRDFCKKVLTVAAETNLGKSILGLLLESNVEIGCILDAESTPFMEFDHKGKQETWWMNVRKITNEHLNQPINDENTLALCCASFVPHELTHWGQFKSPSFIIKHGTPEEFATDMLQHTEAEAVYTEALDTMERQRKGIGYFVSDHEKFAIGEYERTLVKNARSLPLDQLPYLSRISHQEAYSNVQSHILEHKDEDIWWKAYTEAWKRMKGLENEASKPQSEEGNPALVTLLPVKGLLEELLQTNPALLTPEPPIKPLSPEQRQLCRDVLEHMEFIDDEQWLTPEKKTTHELNIAHVMAGDKGTFAYLLTEALMDMNQSMIQKIYDMGLLTEVQRGDAFLDVRLCKDPQEQMKRLINNQTQLRDAITQAQGVYKGM
jgi:hypothetical protein